MWATILGFLQVMKFFLDLWKEKDVKKSEEKAAVAMEVVNAIKETNPKIRASKFNAAVDSINGLRK